MTPLHVAAGAGRTEVVKKLLAAGARINATDNYKNTPLHQALSYGHKVAALALIEAGAELNLFNSRGHTPLHIAAGSQSSVDIVKTILAKGTDVNVHSESGGTPLDRAIEYQAEAVVELLLAHGADIYIKNIDVRHNYNLCFF
jgi:ankyrin repeat protein